jgi:DNA-binding transcriptional regulator YiaG
VRIRLGLSQAGFAQLLAVSKNQIARQERGEKSIREQTARLVSLVDALATKGDDFADVLARARSKR